MRRKCIVTLIIAVLFLVSCGRSLDVRIREQLDLGQKYLTELNYEQAVLAFTKAIELDPKNAEAYTGLGSAYLGQKKYDEAVSAYETAVELDSGSWEAYEGAARGYESLGRMGDAIAIAEQGIEDADPDEESREYVLSLYRKAVSEEEAKNSEGSEERIRQYYEKMRLLKPDEYSVAEAAQDSPVPLGRRPISEKPENGGEQAPAAEEGNVRESDTASKEFTAEDAVQYYGSILSLYKRNVENRWQGDYTEGFDDTGNAPGVIWWQIYSTLDTQEVGYDLVDFDGNGIPELIISPVETAAAGGITELYTIIDGSITHLGSEHSRGWFYLMASNKLGYSGGIGGQMSMRIYDITDSGSGLRITEMVQEDVINHPDNPYSYSDHITMIEHTEGERHWSEPDMGSFRNITESEANAIMDRMQQPVPFQVTPLSAYSEVITNNVPEYVNIINAALAMVDSEHIWLSDLSWFEAAELNETDDCYAVNAEIYLPVEFQTRSEAQKAADAGSYWDVFQNNNGTYSIRGDDQGLDKYTAWEGTVLLRKNAAVSYSAIINQQTLERADLTMPLDRFIKEGYVDNYEYSRSISPGFHIMEIDAEGYVTALQLYLDPNN